ncbi:MAG: sigma-70 family RNA polymerase sigma factor [Verrucomicrobiota bacterium]
MLDCDELERIYDEHSVSAFALFCRFARSEADVRDLLQDWMVQIASKVDSLESVASERSYLLRIAYRLAVDWTRRRNSQQRRVAAASDSGLMSDFHAEEDPDRETLRRALENSLRNLPAEQQIVMQLKLWDAMTFSEIGEVIGISPNTAASRYRYGLSKLQEQLRPFYQELCES